MKLVSVYYWPGAFELLYELLRQRTPEQSISHRSMPLWSEHCQFVARRPYLDWRVIVDNGTALGAVYLTHHGELGVSILQQFRRQGWARKALDKLMRLHPGERFLANINPANEASIALFRSLGFGGPIQITLEKP